MPHLLIVYHTQTGGTRTLAEAALAGARDTPGTRTRLLRAAEAGVDEVLASDGLVFATPENFGYMAGMLKDFFDRVFYPCEGRLNGRPYSVLVCAGNDGTGAMREVDRIVTGLRMRKVHPGVIARRIGGAVGSSRGELAAADIATAREIGAALAAGLELKIF